MALKKVVVGQLLFVFLSCFCQGQNTAVTKLDVAIYYESLCPDSVRFIQEQLVPNWPQIKDYINVKFICFGKSWSSNNGKRFTCQHGPHECAGNKIQSCAFNYLDTQDKQVSFVGCIMSYFGNTQACLSEVGLPVSSINTCYDSDMGIKLQLENEKLTNAIKPRFIPTIVYDNNFNQGDQDRSLEDFKSVVCELLRKKNPEVLFSNCQQGQTVLL